MRSIFRRLPLTVPLKRPHPPCCMRWCMSTAWRPASRTPATTGSTTTGVLRSRPKSTRLDCRPPRKVRLDHHEPVRGAAGLHHLPRLAGYPDGRAAGMVGYGRHRSRQQGTRQQPDRSAQASQSKEQHPAVGMPQVWYYHPEHQGRAGHLCGLHGAVREGRLITAGQRARARVRVVLYIKSQEAPHGYL